jgi:hypothetical protein
MDVRVLGEGCCSGSLAPRVRGRTSPVGALLVVRTYWSVRVLSFVWAPSRPGTIEEKHSHLLVGGWCGAWKVGQKNLGTRVTEKCLWHQCFCCLIFFQKSYIFVLKKSKNKSRHNKWRNLQACKILTWNSLYCRLHKKTKSVKIWRFEIYIPRSTCLLFLCSPELFVFEIKILHVYETIHWLTPWFFSKFFETHKCDFYFFLK